MTQTQNLRAHLLKAIEPALFNYPDKHYIDRALDDLLALVAQERLDAIARVRQETELRGGG